jgi:hypothetical protein
MLFYFVCGAATLTGARAGCDETIFLWIRKERESSLYVCSCNNWWRAMSPATIFREMGIDYKI